jgi:hypothetical protein
MNFYNITGGVGTVYKNSAFKIAALHLKKQNNATTDKM